MLSAAILVITAVLDEALAADRALAEAEAARAVVVRHRRPPPGRAIVDHVFPTSRALVGISKGRAGLGGLQLVNHGPLVTLAAIWRCGATQNR